MREAASVGEAERQLQAGQHRTVPGPVRIVQQRDEALSVVVVAPAVLRIGRRRQVEQGREEVHQADRTAADLRARPTRIGDDQRHPDVGLPEPHLLVVALLTERETVVAEQHHDGVVEDLGLRLECLEQPADLIVHEAGRGQVGEHGLRAMRTRDDVLDLGAVEPGVDRRHRREGGREAVELVLKTAVVFLGHDPAQQRERLKVRPGRVGLRRHDHAVRRKSIRRLVVGTVVGELVEIG